MEGIEDNFVKKYSFLLIKLFTNNLEYTIQNQN